MSSEELGNAETLPGSGDPPSETVRRAPGTVLLDRYRIVRWLGAGGMGAVYAAHDARLDQQVALKFVAGARSDVERERLREEVRTLQGLTHRGIARTYTFDEADGEPFIVMELLDGETLAARIARGALDESEARVVLAAVATALDEAHRAGVVHRDVKPSNVMLCPGGRVVLMDFGLARADDAPAPTGASTSILLTTSLKGTPAYLAPEMALGRRVDARADLYSLGVLGYEALTGKLPFEAASAKGMIDAHVARVPDDVRARRPEVSPALGALIKRLLAKEPDARPASAAAVIAALATRRGRRWPWVVAAAVLATAAVIAIFVTRDHTGPPSQGGKPPGAMLDEGADAKAMYARGTQAYEAGEFARAFDLYMTAYDRVPDPAFLFNMAQAARLAGKVREASFFYRQYLHLNPGTSAAMRARVEGLITGLEGAPDAGP